MKNSFFEKVTRQILPQGALIWRIFIICGTLKTNFDKKKSTYLQTNYTIT